MTSTPKKCNLNKCLKVALFALVACLIAWFLAFMAMQERQWQTNDLYIEEQECNK